MVNVWKSKSEVMRCVRFMCLMVNVWKSKSEVMRFLRYISLMVNVCESGSTGDCCVPVTGPFVNGAAVLGVKWTE